MTKAEALEEGTPDAGPSGLGEAAATSLEEAPSPTLQEVLAEEAPPEPRPGQTRPDKNGRCPYKGQVALNRGCWLVAWDVEKCRERGGQMFKGLCYVPFIAPGRSPTAHPMDKQ